MATGTIKNQQTGTWTSINANLKYQVRNGVVFVWAKGTATTGTWAAVGTLPSDIAVPVENVYLTSYTQGNSSYGNYYINKNDRTVYFAGTNTASTIISYPLS